MAKHKRPVLLIFCNIVPSADIVGNVVTQLWVLQVVGSNPAAPTNKNGHFSHFYASRSSQKSPLGRLWEDHRK